MWDQWNDFKVACHESSTSSKKELILVGVFHKWYPAAMYVAQVLAEIREEDRVPFASIYIIQAEPQRRLECLEMETIITPALVFYWKGKPMTIRRDGWADAKAFVGPIEKDQLIEILRYAYDQGQRKISSLICDV